MRATSRVLHLALFSLGCATAAPRPTPHPLRAEGLAVRQLDLGRFALTAKVDVVNDGDTPWQLQSAQTQVAVDGVLSGSDRVPLSQTVPPHQSLAVEIPAAAEPLHDASSLREWASRGERRIAVVVSGALQFSDGGTIRDLPFEAAGTLDPPKLPVARMEEAAMTGVPPDRRAVFVMRVTNANPFAVPVRTVSCHASLGGQTVTEGDAEGPREVPAGGSASYRWSGPVPPSEHPEHRMAEGRLDYRLDGELNLGRITLPLHFEGPLESAR